MLFDLKQVSSMLTMGLGKSFSFKNIMELACNGDLLIVFCLPSSESITPIKNSDIEWKEGIGRFDDKIIMIPKTEELSYSPDLIINLAVKNYHPLLSDSNIKLATSVIDSNASVTINQPTTFYAINSEGDAIRSMTGFFYRVPKAGDGDYGNFMNWLAMNGIDKCNMNPTVKSLGSFSFEEEARYFARNDYISLSIDDLAVPDFSVNQYLNKQKSLNSLNSDLKGFKAIHKGENGKGNGKAIRILSKCWDSFIDSEKRYPSSADALMDWAKGKQIIIVNRGDNKDCEKIKMGDDECGWSAFKSNFKKTLENLKKS